MEKILIIDDNNSIRENTAEILELAGYITYTAPNGKKGVEIALKEKPDLIVCDIMMPELDGYGVLHLLKKNKETEQIPFIYLTAKTERSDFRKGMEMGADDYITKPFDDVELLRAIQIRLKKSAIVETTYGPGETGANSFIRDLNASGVQVLNPEEYETENYPRKHILYSEGKRPKNLFYLKKGKIKTFRLHDNGKEYITNLYAAGDYLGYIPLIEESNYEDTAEVIEDAEVVSLQKDEFLQALANDMNIARKFIRIITDNVREKEDRLLNMAYDSLRKRVAKAMISIHEKYYHHKAEQVIDISREDIAQFVGTATESLIRTLSDFKSEKLIEIQNAKIRILDIEKLKNLLY